MMDKKLLIIDDMEMNRDMLSEILEDYKIITSGSGMEALDIIRKKKNEIAAVLLDLVMPDMDGYQILGILQKEGFLEKIPVIIITGEESVLSEKNCFALGASDFIRKPFDNTLVRRRVENVVKLYDYQNTLKDKVKTQTLQLKTQYNMLLKQAESLKKNNQKIIEILGTVVECRNLESGQHIKRVMAYTDILARQFKKDNPEYKLSDNQIEKIVAASALHDIGKIAIPDSILLKPGRLTKEEFDYMKSHTTRGCELLKNIEDAWDSEYGKYSYEICRSHHERFDGKGYPEGLKGDEIPISAQLVSVADVYDALVSERCYKDAYSKEEAFIMIIRGECGVFSPKLMKAFRMSREAFERVVDELND